MFNLASYTDQIILFVEIIVSFGAGVAGAYFTFILNAKKVRQDAANDLRDDLMKLFEDNSLRIDKLSTEIMSLREKNADIQSKNLELREHVTTEREKVIQLQSENNGLRREIEHLQSDRVRHANRIIILEDEIRTLKSQVSSNTESIIRGTH